MADLGTLPGDLLSFASNINNKGQVVGTSCGSTSCRAFVWQNGTMTDLNRVRVRSDLFLASAVGINDRGEITGFTPDFRAFLATPAPGQGAATAQWRPQPERQAE